MKKQAPTTCCLQETYFRETGIKSKGVEGEYRVNIDLKKAGVHKLVSIRDHFTSREQISDREAL